MVPRDKSGPREMNQGPREDQSGTREPGGGAVGATYPPNLETMGAPPTLNRQCHLFLFLFVFARELGSLPKNSEPNPVSF